MRRCGAGGSSTPLRPPLKLHDPFFYLYYSRRAVTGDGFYRLKDGEPTAYYPIGYPVILSAWFWFMQHSPFPNHWIAATGALNLIFSTASIALAGVLGRRLVGPWVGAVTAVIVALFPSLIFHSATILTETTFNFFLLLTLLVGCWHPWNARDPSWGRLVAFGLLLGVSIQIRPIALLIVPMVLIAMWRVGGMALALKRFAVVAGAVVVLMVPWTIRNEVVMHAFLPIGTTTGDNLCIGNYPGAQGHFAFPKRCFGENKIERRPAFETDRNSRLTHQALQWAANHPVRELELVRRPHAVGVRRRPRRRRGGAVLRRRSLHPRRHRDDARQHRRQVLRHGPRPRASSGSRCWSAGVTGVVCSCCCRSSPWSSRCGPSSAIRASTCPSTCSSRSRRRW